MFLNWLIAVLSSLLATPFSVIIIYLPSFRLFIWYLQTDHIFCITLLYKFYVI